MLSTLALASLLGAPQIAAAGGCNGADPAITRAVVKSTTQNGPLTHYVLAITVTNLGTAKQPSNLLQSVEVYQNGNKVDRKGVKPLAPHASTTVTYAFDRSVDANSGTTDFRFHLILGNMPAPGLLDCRTDNDTYVLTV